MGVTLKRATVQDIVRAVFACVRAEDVLDNEVKLAAGVARRDSLNHLARGLPLAVLRRDFDGNVHERPSKTFCTSLRRNFFALKPAT